METLLLDPDLARETAVNDDKERLQGSWNFVSGIREAQMLIAGDHFTVKFKNGDIYLGDYTLDPTAQAQDDGHDHPRRAGKAPTAKRRWSSTSWTAII